MVAPHMYGDKMGRYVKARGGTIIATDVNEVSSHSINKTLYLRYSDKNHNVREVALTYIGPFTFFGEDVIVHYSSDSPEFRVMKEEKKAKRLAEEKAQEELDKRLESSEGENYDLGNDGILNIKQEYEQPNIGELVYLNGEKAPNGKYKIGFMGFAYVENGRIVALEMN